MLTGGVLNVSIVISRSLSLSANFSLESPRFRFVCALNLNTIRPDIHVAITGVMDRDNGGSMPDVWASKGFVRVRYHQHGTTACEGPPRDKEMGKSNNYH
jgi:hypothetical protein